LIEMHLDDLFLLLNADFSVQLLSFDPGTLNQPKFEILDESR